MKIQRGRDVFLVDCEGIMTKKVQNPKKRRRTSYIESEASEASEPETEPETEEVDEEETEVDEEATEASSDSRKRKRYRREHR